MFYIITPAYNRAHTIERTIKSVLGQKYDKYKIIIIDDWSTDNTEEIIKRYIDKYWDKIVYFYKANWWVGSARNVWIEYMLKSSKDHDKDYMMQLDSDDEILENSLEEINKIVVNGWYKDVYLFGCVDQYWNKVTKFPEEFYNKDISYFDFFAKNCWEAFGIVKVRMYQNKKLRFREDIKWSAEWFLRTELSFHAKFHIVPNYFRRYYINENESLMNISKINDKLNDYIYNYSEYLKLYWDLYLKDSRYHKIYWEYLLLLARFKALKWNKIESVHVFMEWFRYNKSIKNGFLYIISFIDYNCILYNMFLKINIIIHKLILFNKKYLNLGL